jgi:hypothetical protein
MKQIQVIQKSDKSVIHSIDVTGKSDRQIERVEDGININLNHDEFYTVIAEVETRQEKRS